jgi:2-dehydro-3-deoxy-D-arabinonate dehydratase
MKNEKPYRLYRAASGFFAEQDGHYYVLNVPEWDALITRDDLYSHLQELTVSASRLNTAPFDDLLAPIGSQEVWAAGVTYYRSRNARMEESKSAGGGDFYDRVYDAARPELFFKATPHRVVGQNGAVAIRSDAKWSVPEPELTLVITPSGTVVGYTVGNDMSSRDIEGENPLYLPQAKVYDRSCALGPCIWVHDKPLNLATDIHLEILRSGERVFADSTTLNSLRRQPAELVEYLFRDNSFPRGCFLLTGTGIVPPDSFTLQRGDEIRISIPPIGTLVNQVG